MTDITFSEKIKRARKQAGLSAEKFAAKYNIPANTYRDWEAGRSKPPAYTMPMILAMIEKDLIKSEFERSEEDTGKEDPVPQGRGDDKSFHLLKGQVYDMFFPVVNIQSLAKYHQVPNFPRAIIRTIVHDAGNGETVVSFLTGFEHYKSFLIS